MLSSPINYFGSKRRIASKILNLVPDHYSWVEVFCGSASLTFAKKPSSIEVINDTDVELVNCLTQIKCNPQELADNIYLTPYASMELELARIPEIGLSDVERARRFFVQSIMAVNGSFGSGQGGFSFTDSFSRQGREGRLNRWYNLPGKILATSPRLANVEISCLDYAVLIEAHSQECDTVLYLDPPYLSKGRVMGYTIDSNNEKWHEQLLNAIQHIPAMTMISGYESDLYLDMLTIENGWSLLRLSTTTRGTTGKDFARVECLWLNDAYQKAIRNKKELSIQHR